MKAIVYIFNGFVLHLWKKGLKSESFNKIQQEKNAIGAKLHNSTNYQGLPSKKPHNIKNKQKQLFWPSDSTSLRTKELKIYSNKSNKQVRYYFKIPCHKFTVLFHSDHLCVDEETEPHGEFVSSSFSLTLFSLSFFESLEQSPRLYQSLTNIQSPLELRDCPKVTRVTSKEVFIQYISL